MYKRQLLDLFSGLPIETSALEYEDDLLKTQFNTDEESGTTTQTSFEFFEPFELDGQSLFGRIELTTEVEGNVIRTETRLYNRSSPRLHGYYGDQFFSQNSRGEGDLPLALRSGYAQNNILMWHHEVTDQNGITTNDTYSYENNSLGCPEEIKRTDMNGFETTIAISLEEVVIP